MSANAANRESARDYLASLLQTALVGEGLPAQAVYGYQASDFGGQSPVVLVISAGSVRQRFGLGTQKFKTFERFEVLVFVIDADGTWTDANVEDRLDLLEKEIADVIGDNRSTDYWSDIRHDASGSRVVPANVGGHAYKLEIIPVICEVHDA